MSEDKTKSRKGNVQKPVKMFRVGAIAASVWMRAIKVRAIKGQAFKVI
jgi:hypothetical protein